MNPFDRSVDLAGDTFVSRARAPRPRRRPAKELS